MHHTGVGSCSRRSTPGLTNVRIAQHDAVEVLCHMIAHNTFDGVHVFFPDLAQEAPSQAPSLCSRLSSRCWSSAWNAGAYLHVATDWQEYAEYVLAVLKNNPLLVNTATDYAPRPAYRPQTKFESRGLKLATACGTSFTRR